MTSPDSNTVMRVSGSRLNKLGVWLALRPWVSRSAVSLYIVALGAIAFWPQVFDGASFPWDFQGKYTTAPAFVAASIDNGEIPTWAQGTGGGMPILEDPGSGVYYPVWWIAGITSVPLTLNLMAKIQVAHVIFGGLGVVALMRARRFPWFWAACGATAFLLSGMFFGQAQHADFIRGFALFPWLMWSLTPRDGDRPWIRLIALPPLAYLGASGIYPGQIASFPILLSAAMVTTLWQRRELLNRRTFLVLGLAGLAALLAIALVWGPFSAGLGNELDRPNPATVNGRARSSAGATDTLAGFLNPFAFHQDGTTYAWAVSVPILMGLAGLRRSLLSRYASIVAVGLVAAFVGAIGAWHSVGRLMLGLGPLFTSRFAFADYKVAVVLALIVLGSAGWREIIRQPARHLPRVAAAGGIALFVLWLGTDIQMADATSREWAVTLAIVAPIAATVAATRARYMLALVVLLVAVGGDSLRNAADHQTESGVSSWSTRPSAAYVAERDGAVGALAENLAAPPESRLARLPPFRDPAVHPQGTPTDSFGYIGLGYHIQRHGGLQTTALALAFDDPEVFDAMLQPWAPRIVGCDVVDCDSIDQLPPQELWAPTDAVETTRYDQDAIDYAVDLDQRVLMIENELNHPFWRSEDPGATAVVHDGVLRAWILEPGSYAFTSRYQTSALRRATVLGGLLVALWIATSLAALRKEPSTAVSEAVEGQSRSPTAG